MRETIENYSRNKLRFRKNKKETQTQNPIS